MNANTNVGPIAVSPIAPVAPRGEGESGGARNQRQPTAGGHYRLVIEEGPQPGSFVYKTLDRVTGEVVQQLPREEVVRMLDDGAYAKGSVFDTSA